MKSDETIFAEALEKRSPEERRAYLEEVCAGNAKLRGDVEALLAAHERSGGILDVAALTVDPGAAPASTLEPIGAMIGPYKLLECIGEGGMGVVYMAEQVWPVRRKVALKVIKPGMDTRQTLARFEAERQALALMEHPNIARVLDAGATDSGRPYFVMELVRGIPITDYCDQQSLPPRERLALFATVCHAVQHAHQKGIIHRDLKPGNVLVTLHDGEPVVKVIDFGIAKATGQQLTEKTLFTGFNQMIGTPLYISPEQAEYSGLDVDTRTDIYSLGVLLYELLTGTTPFEKSRLQQAAFDEIRRIIREEEPPRPSTRLSTLGATLTTVSARRRTEPRRLTQVVRGELDWIVMKALEKDRRRRYETASAMAADVDRYLRDETVEACPPSAGYRLRKFTHRHRAALTVAGLVVLLLTGGTIVSTWQAIRASRAEAKALANEHRALTSEKEALANAQRAEEVSNFLVAAFRSPDPERDGRTITIAEVLDRSVKELEDKFTDDPRTKAVLLEAIGESYRGLGLWNEAIPLLEKVHDLRARALGKEHLDTLKAKVSLSNAYIGVERYAEAEATIKEVLTHASLAPDHSIRLSAMSSLAIVYRETRRAEEAALLLKDILRSLKSTMGPEDRDTIDATRALAWSYQRLGRASDAVPLQEETLNLARAEFGFEHADTIALTADLACLYSEIGRSDEAVTLMQESVERLKTRFGPEHPRTLVNMSNLAVIYQRAGRLDEAVSLLEEAVRAAKNQFGGVHSRAVYYMNNLARTYAAKGRQKDAVALFQEVVDDCRARLGAHHRLTLEAMNNLVVAYEIAGWMEDAVSQAEETLRLRRSVCGPDDIATIASISKLGQTYRLAGRLDEAVPLYEETVRLRKAKFGREHWLTVTAMSNLTQAYRIAGRPHDALPLFREIVELRPRDAVFINRLAWLLATCPDPTLRSPAEAIVLGRRAVELAPTNGKYWGTLGSAYYQAGDWPAAIEALRKAVELRSDGGDGLDWLFLAMACWQQGHQEEARVWLTKTDTRIPRSKLNAPEFRRFRAEAEALIGVLPASTATAPAGQFGLSSPPDADPASRAATSHPSAGEDR